MKKPSKKAAISALLIGILGTAIWEKIISPLCTFIYIKLSLLIDKYTTIFSNNTYKEISKGYNDMVIFEAFVYIIIYFIFFLFALFFLFRKRERIKISHSNLDKSQKPFSLLKDPFNVILLISFFCIVMGITSMYWVGNFTFINNCKTTSLCNLEIICPYISDIEYKKLKSSFYSIQTKEDYEIFTKTIKEIGNKHSLNLKE